MSWLQPTSLRLATERRASSSANTAAFASSRQSAPLIPWKGPSSAPSIRLRVPRASALGPASRRDGLSRIAPILSQGTTYCGCWQRSATLSCADRVPIGGLARVLTEPHMVLKLDMLRLGTRCAGPCRFHANHVIAASPAESGSGGGVVRSEERHATSISRDVDHTRGLGAFPAGQESRSNIASRWSQRLRPKRKATLRRVGVASPTGTRDRRSAPVRAHEAALPPVPYAIR